MTAKGPHVILAARFQSAPGHPLPIDERTIDCTCGEAVLSVLWDEHRGLSAQAIRARAGWAKRRIAANLRP